MKYTDHIKKELSKTGQVVSEITADIHRYIHILTGEIENLIFFKLVKTLPILNFKLD